MGSRSSLWPPAHGMELLAVLTDNTQQSPVVTCSDYWAAGRWLSQQAAQGVRTVDLPRKLMMSGENHEWGCKN